MNKEIIFKAWGELNQAVDVLDDLVNRLSVGAMVDAGEDDRQYRFGLTDAKLTAIKLHGVLQIMRGHIDERVMAN